MSTICNLVIPAKAEALLNSRRLVNRSSRDERLAIHGRSGTKSWIPAFAGMTGMQASGANLPQGNADQVAFARHPREGGDPASLSFKDLKTLDDQT